MDGGAGRLRYARRGEADSPWLGGQVHRGSSFAKHRCAASSSLTVSTQYFMDETMRFRKGRFDLRNVLCLRASTDPDCAHGVDILLSESSDIPPRHTKTVVLDWGSAAVLELWLSLWTSAVALAHVDPLLHAHRDPQLASTFNVVRGGEPPLRTSVRLPSRTPLLSPRERRRTSCADLRGELTSAASMRPGDRTLTGHPSLRTLPRARPPTKGRVRPPPQRCRETLRARARLTARRRRCAAHAAARGGAFGRRCVLPWRRAECADRERRRENDELDSPRSDQQPRWRKSPARRAESFCRVIRAAPAAAERPPAARGPRACARRPVR